jgi:hypothetical protein
MSPSFTKPHALECKPLKPTLVPQIARLPEITQLLFDPNEQTQEEATREFRKLLSIGHDPFHKLTHKHTAHAAPKMQAGIQRGTKRGRER